MNKQDIILISIILMIVTSFFIIFRFTAKKGVTKAIVYYEQKEVLAIDLLKDETKEYEVEGYNGTVKIIAKKGKVKIESENSPLHLCSKQGYISKSYETIVCLPNKIIIRLEGTNEDIDAVIE